MTMAKTWNTADLADKDKKYMLHPVSNLHQLQETGPLVFTRGEGVYLWDSDGKRYIDAFAGLWNVNVGHGRPRTGRGGQGAVAGSPSARPSSAWRRRR